MRTRTPEASPAPCPAEPGRREGWTEQNRRAEPGRGPCARPGSPPMSCLKATRAEIAPSYSWCLGRFIKCVRHGADYFSGNKENRKADSTEPVTSCFRSGSHRPVWAGARRHTGPLGQPAAVGLRLPLASGFQGPESRKAQRAGCSPGPSRPWAESPVRRTWAKRKRASTAPLPRLSASPGTGPRPSRPTGQALQPPRAPAPQVNFIFLFLCCFPKLGQENVLHDNYKYFIT